MLSVKPSSSLLQTGRFLPTIPLNMLSETFFFYAPTCNYSWYFVPVHSSANITLTVKHIFSFPAIYPLYCSSSLCFCRLIKPSSFSLFLYECLAVALVIVVTLVHPTSWRHLPFTWTGVITAMKSTRMRGHQCSVQGQLCFLLRCRDPSQSSPGT